MIAPLKKPKKPKRRTLRNKADALWSQVVRAKGKCEAEGISAQCGGVLQAAHGFPRTYYGTRWTVLNGFCICAGHHRWFTSHPLEWTAFMIERLGELPYEELRRMALTKVKADYETSIYELGTLRKQQEVA